MCGLYFTGIAVGILAALVMKRSIFRGEPVPFVMELPNYQQFIHKKGYPGHIAAVLKHGQEKEHDANERDMIEHIICQDRKKNSVTIIGRNPSTLPTPLNIPSIISEQSVSFTFPASD